MRKFVVGYLCFFDEDLEMEVVEADSDVQAIRKASFAEGWKISKECGTVKELQNFVGTMNAVVSVIEL